MGASNKREYSAPLSAEERKLAAWENARATSDSCRRVDCSGLPIHWDQFEKRSAYGWFIEHIIPLEEGGSDEPINLRARHWCESLEQFEAGLLMNL